MNNKKNQGRGYRPKVADEQRQERDGGYIPVTNQRETAYKNVYEAIKNRESYINGT